MRTVTTAEYDAALAAQNAVFMRLDVTDPDGAWRDVGALGLAGTNFFNGASLSGDLDDLTHSFAAELLRDQGPTESLSPLMEDSLLNRDSGDNYAPFLDLARFWRLRICVKETPEEPTLGQYRELARGVLDDFSMPQGPTIAALGRGMEALLLDVEIAPKKYGSNAAPVPMETVIQEMIDDTLGPGVFTLYTPVSPVFVMDEWNQQPMSLMEAISIVADRDGFIVRFKYDENDLLRLTLFEPDRSGTTPVFTFGPGQYQPIARAGFSIKGVRNEVTVEYQDRTLGRRTIKYPASGTSPSITRYRKRTLPIALAPETQVVTEEKAVSFAGKVCSDLEWPFLEQQIAIKGVWFLEVYDFGNLLPNGKHYSTTQGAGITGFTLAYVDGKLTFTFDAKARPAGRYKTWLDMGTPTQLQPTTPTLTLVSTPVTAGNPATADVVLRVETSNGERAGLWLDDQSGATDILCVSGSDAARRYVVSGTEIGPADWFHNGVRFAQRLNDIPLLRTQPTQLFVLAIGETSQLKSPWLPITLESAELPPAAGDLVDVAIALVVNKPGERYVLAGNGDAGIAMPSYNATPFTQIRLAGEVAVANPGAVLGIESSANGTSGWQSTGAELPLEAVGPIRGVPAAISLAEERWFRAVLGGMGASTAELKSLYLYFLPRAYSIPPAAVAMCNSALVGDGVGIGPQRFSENFCAYTTKEEWAAAALAYENTSNGEYGIWFALWDLDIEDGNASAYEFGTVDPWNGGHHYLRTLHPAGAVWRSGLMPAAGQGLGPTPWSTWRAERPDPTGPYYSRIRLVVMFSAGYVVASTQVYGGYHILCTQFSLPYQPVGNPNTYSQGHVQLTIQNRLEGGVPGPMRLYINFSFTLNGGVPIALGLASDLVFDGEAHTWELITDRFGTSGDRWVIVKRDGVVLFSQVIVFQGAYEATYYPTYCEVMESYGGPTAYGSIELPTEQEWRLYEFEYLTAGMPTISLG